MQGGKFRIEDYFSKPHSAKEKADFLKDEYGIGGIKHTQTVFQLKSGSEKLKIIGDNLFYNFYIGDTHLGCGQAKYLSSEVSGGFTGVVIGLYAIGSNSAEFEDFRIEYKYTTE